MCIAYLNYKLADDFWDMSRCSCKNISHFIQSINGEKSGVITQFGLSMKLLCWAL